MTNGQTHTVNNIPAGTTCTVTETSPTAPSGYSYAAPVINPASPVTIVGGQTTAVSVLNQMTATSGTLTISKAVVGGVDPQAFELELNCSDNAFDDVISLTNGQTHTVNNIPAGTTCTVTETSPTAPSGYSYAPPR